MKIDVGHSLGRPRAVVLLSSLPRGKRKSETMQINGKKGGVIRAALPLAPHTRSQSIEDFNNYDRVILVII